MQKVLGCSAAGVDRRIRRRSFSAPTYPRVAAIAMQRNRPPRGLPSPAELRRGVLLTASGARHPGELSADGFGPICGRIFVGVGGCVAAELAG